MKKIICISTLLLLGQLCVGQINLSYRHRIDSISAFIDSQDIQKVNVPFTSDLDSLIGGQITSVDKQVLKNLSKYSLRTNENYLFEIYLLKTKLIKVTVYWKTHWRSSHYFLNNKWKYATAPACYTRILMDDKRIDYGAITKKLIEVKP